MEVYVHEHMGLGAYLMHLGMERKMLVTLETLFSGSLLYTEVVFVLFCFQITEVV